MKLITLIISCILFSNLALARDKKQDKLKRGGERLKEELNLSEDQVKKMAELRNSHKESHEKLKAQVQVLRKAFREAKENEKTSNEELTTRFEALQKARSDLQRERFKNMLERRSLLTPEQRKGLKEQRKNRKGQGGDEAESEED